MATTVWKGHLTFGLISIPINLCSAARSERIGLNQIHKECHSRLKQPLFCPTCNRNVERSELVKGYEYEKDQYLLFKDGELDKLEPDSARTMEILEFVKLEEVDPLYFDTSYYATPKDAGKKAYGLLFKAMENSGYGAIAKLTMHQRENIVVIRPRANGLTLHTMFYANEIRKLSEYGLPHAHEIKEQEMKLAQQLIESLAAPFQADKYRDEYQESLRGMIDVKLKGKEISDPQIRQMAPVLDLMEALKKSLDDKPTVKKPPARSLTMVAAEQKEPRKKSA